MKSFLNTGNETFSLINGIKFIFPPKNFSSVKIDKHFAPAFSYVFAILRGSKFLHKIPLLGDFFLISAIIGNLLPSTFFKLDKKPLSFTFSKFLYLFIFFIF